MGNSVSPKIASYGRPWLVLTAALSFLTVQAKEVEYGGIIYEVDDYYQDYATPLRYDGKTPDVILAQKFKIGGQEYELMGDYSEILTNQDNIKSVDASELPYFYNPLSGCRNLVTVITSQEQVYYEKRQFFDCPSLDLSSVLTPNIQYVSEYCFAMSEPTDIGTFDNINIKACLYNREALQNRLYSTVIINETPEEGFTESPVLLTLNTEGIKALYASGCVIDNYYPIPFTALETLVLTDGSVQLGENFPSIKSVTLKGKINELSIDSYSNSIQNVDLNVSEATEIGYVSIHNIPSMTTIDFKGKAKEVYVSKMPALVSLSGLEGVKRTQITECNSLTKLELPDLEEFGSEAFSGNKSLKEVYFGDKLREISNSDTFYGCKALEDLIYGGTIEQWLGIKQYVEEFEPNSAMLAKVPNFWYGHGNAKMTKLTELNSSHVGNADTISIGAFTGYKGLTKIDLPATVKVIGTAAFDGCTNLKDVNIRAERIDQHAFLFCSEIENYTLGDQLTYIGPAFYSNKINYGTVNFLGTPDQWLKIVRTTLGYIDPWNPDEGEGYSRVGSPTIPCKDVLFNGKPLENLVIEDDVEEINNSFARIQSLQLLTIKCGDKLPKISYQAFYNCSNLKKVTVEFVNRSRSEFDLKNGFEIGEDAFSACSSLKEIEVLNYIKSIGKGALSGTQWLKDQPANEVVYLNTERGLTAYTYNGTPVEGSKLVIKDGCEALNSGAFYSWYNSTDQDFSGFNSIFLPASVKYIGQSALSGINFKGDVTLPGTVEEIESNDFSGEIDKFTFESGSTVLKSPDEYQSTLYIRNAKTVNYNRNFKHISVQGLDECKKVTYGSNLTEVTTGMTSPGSTTEVYSYSANPPVCGYYASPWNPDYHTYPQFDINPDSCVLYVPAGSIEAYRNADGWNLFTTIQPDNSAVEDIMADKAPESEGSHYDIYGRPISSDAKGIHIVINAQGKVTKRLVK